VSIIAAVRPSEWNLPLFLHVLGAMILVGGLLTGASALAFARGQAQLSRLGYWSLLVVALPGWVLMRVGAQWIYTKEGWDELPEGIDDPTWLATGAIIGDVGGLVLVLALIVGGIGVRRLRLRSSTGLLTATLVLSLILLAAYLVAVWAMAGKPA
jgi:ABC-type maltose transport system permease subunit